MNLMFILTLLYSYKTTGCPKICTYTKYHITANIYKVADHEIIREDFLMLLSNIRHNIPQI